LCGVGLKDFIEDIDFTLERTGDPMKERKRESIAGRTLISTVSSWSAGNFTTLLLPALSSESFNGRKRATTRILHSSAAIARCYLKETREDISGKHTK
jgi:hypothetical protein